jgi:hypothetical protein
MTIAPKDPARAQQMSQQLPMWQRLAVYIQVAGGVAHQDPDRAEIMFSEAKTQMSKIDDAQAQFQILMVLASAAAGLRGQDLSRDALTKAYDLGEELIEEDVMEHPGRPIHQAKNFADIEQLAALSYRIAPDWTLDRSQSIKLSAVRAELCADLAFLFTSDK